MRLRRFILIAAVVLASAGVLAGSLFVGLEEGEALWPLGWLVWAPVGYVILDKRPGNMVGATLLSIGLFWGVGFGSLALSVGVLDGEASAWAELVSVVFGVPPWIGIVWLLLIFPSGALADRLAKGVSVGLLGFTTLAVFAFIVHPGPLESTGIPNPLGVESLDSISTFVTDERGFLAVIVLLVLSLISVLSRWRRSSGVERHQYRWLFFGASLFLSILAIGQVLPEESNAVYLWIISGVSIPVSIGFAVTRYRLYEIDRIISRTASYALVVGVLGALFTVGVVWLPSYLSLGDSSIAIAASTLAVAALFNPLRGRVQRIIDRRFNRSRYNIGLVMDGFAGSLREGVNPELMVDGWMHVVGDTMQPASVAVWVRE